MKYIFFIILSITIFSMFFYKKKSVQVSILLLIILILMLLYPESSLNAAKEGINLWLFIVIPSLIPFFIINDMLIALKIPENIGRIFAPIAKFLFNTSGYGAYVFIMSIFSGYPSGAKITAQLIEGKKITDEEGQKILTFSSTSGPLFIIGAVGAGMLKNPASGYILFISHITSSILNGILIRLLFKKSEGNHYTIKSNYQDIKDIGNIFSKAISNSLITSGFIGGYIILFSVIIDLLNKIEYFKILNSFLEYVNIPDNISKILSLCLEASIEISNGCKILSKSEINNISILCLISFIIAFSGFSIIGQVSSLINKTKISLKKYILSKFSHGILSAIICYIVLKYNIMTIPTNSLSDFSIIGTIPALMILLLTLMLILNSLSNIKIRKTKR